MRGAGTGPAGKGVIITASIFCLPIVEDTPDFNDLPSKSQRKRNMDALQDIGAELTELNGKVGRISSESQDMAAIELRGRAAGAVRPRPESR